jgi:predicted nucleotidyltransferase component of viral defense system
VNQRQVRNLTASIRDRLRIQARERNEEFQLILTQYAIDRLLYRLSSSPHADRFVLKGAMLVSIWGGGRYRVTRDVDLLKFGSSELDHIETLFREVCEAPVDVADGLTFDPDSVRAQAIREPNEYDGVRVKMTVFLDRAQILVQVDVGFGDAITPSSEVIELPGFLDFPRTRFRAYPKETVVAEKFQAMVALGMANTRMKDFYDVWFLATRFAFKGPSLASAVKATFARRRTALPEDTPAALTMQFHDDDNRRRQWAAFLARTRPEAQPPGLPDVAALIWRFVGPAVAALRNASADTGSVFEKGWPAGGPWDDNNAD